MQSESTRIQPLGSYSKLRRAGDFAYVAGTTARTERGDIAGTSVEANGMRRHDVAAQTRFALLAVADTLAQIGWDLDDCVDVTVFLTDMNDFAAFNRVYAEYFAANRPTRTTIGVAQLPHPDMVVEIKAIAYREPA